MTVFLIALAAFALLCTAAAATDVGFRVKFDGGLTVIFFVGVYRRVIYPSKPDKLRLSDYSIASLRKKRRAAARKAAKAKKSEQPRVAEQHKKPAVTATLRYYFRVVKTLLTGFGSKMSVKIHSFAVTVATDDAASTALAYGYASQAAAYFFAFLESKCDIKYDRHAHTGIFADFTAASPALDLDITLKIKSAHLISIAASGLKLLSARK